MGVASYVINFDELADLLKAYLSNGVDVDIGSISMDMAGMENLLRDIESKIQGVDYTSLIAALNQLNTTLGGLSGNLGMSGTQKVYGYMLELVSDSDTPQQTITFNVPATGQITGVTYSLSAWNYEDTWDLLVGDTTLFKGVRTKEYGEHKFFNVFYPITAGQDIKFVFNNTSTSSKILWVDFEVLET